MAASGGSKSSLSSSGDSVVTEECVEELLEFFSRTAFRTRNVDRRYEIIHKKCLHLIARDYKINVIDNKGGQLCGHYPSELIVMEADLDSTTCVNSSSKLKELLSMARFARCRSRFVMPVIFYQNKNVCRSSTLSTMAELYGRTGIDWIFTGGEATGTTEPGSQTPPTSEVVTGSDSTGGEQNDSVLLNRVRGQDVQVLQLLEVKLICDLMVEKRKMKYGLYVSSSEKVDKWSRYSDFHIASMPYPGCEFFKVYRNNGYNPVSLKFDWRQSAVDADLSIPEALQNLGNIPFQRYQGWDLVEITQNYLKFLLHYLHSCEGGMLIHCISGWDRTPLFISLMRLSLWADDAIHQSLGPSEMLYFTLAYDWFLYGHQLKERHEKGEEIMYFCFDFLKYIMYDEYSMNVISRPRRGSSMHSSDSASYSSFSRHTTSVATPSGTTPNETTTSGTLCGSDGSKVTENRRSTRASTSSREPSLSLTDSLQHVLVDSRYDECYYNPSSNVQQSFTSSRSSSSSMSESQASSLRGKRLHEVRQLFLRTYRSSVPDVSEQPSGGGISGFLSKLASSVLSND